MKWFAQRARDAVLLFSATSAVAFVGTHPDPKAQPLKKECSADLPVASSKEQRDAAKAVLLANLPGFKQGRFEDFAVVTAVADHTGSNSPAGCQEDAYGELPLDWALQMFSVLELGANDTFEDLGSGLGKLPIAAAVLGGADRAIGVELSKKRHRLACEGLSKVSKALRSIPSKRTAHVELRLADLLDENVTKASVVYASSICYRKALMKMMGQKLGSQLPEGARAAVTTSFPSELPARLSSQGPKKVGSVSLNFYRVKKVPTVVHKERSESPRSVGRADNVTGTIMAWGKPSKRARPVPLDSSMHGSIVGWGQEKQSARKLRGADYAVKLSIWGRRADQERQRRRSAKVTKSEEIGGHNRNRGSAMTKGRARQALGPGVPAGTESARRNASREEEGWEPFRGPGAADVTKGGNEAGGSVVALNRSSDALRTRSLVVENDASHGKSAHHHKRRVGLKNLLRRAMEDTARENEERRHRRRHVEFTKVEHDQQSIVNGTVVHKVVKEEVADLGKELPVLWRWSKGFGDGEGTQPVGSSMHEQRIMAKDEGALTGFGK